MLPTFIWPLLSPRRCRASASPACELVVELAHGFCIVQAGDAGAFGVILVRQRRAPERHDRVADVLVERAAVILKTTSVTSCRYAFISRPAPPASELSEMRGEVAHVGEQDGHVAALAFHRNASGFFAISGDQLGGTYLPNSRDLARAP